MHHIPIILLYFNIIYALEVIWLYCVSMVETPYDGVLLSVFPNSILVICFGSLKMVMMASTENSWHYKSGPDLFYSLFRLKKVMEKILIMQITLNKVLCLVLNMKGYHLINITSVQVLQLVQQ